MPEGNFQPASSGQFRTSRFPGFQSRGGGGIRGEAADPTGNSVSGAVAAGTGSAAPGIRDIPRPLGGDADNGGGAASDPGSDAKQASSFQAEAFGPEPSIESFGAPNQEATFSNIANIFSTLGTIAFNPTSLVGNVAKTIGRGKNPNTLGAFDFSTAPDAFGPQNAAFDPFGNNPDYDPANDPTAQESFGPADNPSFDPAGNNPDYDPENDAYGGPSGPDAEDAEAAASADQDDQDSPGGAGVGHGGDDGGAGGGDDSVICTALYRQGLLSREIWVGDSHFGLNCNRAVKRGYLVWGVPYVRRMAVNDRLGRLMKRAAVAIVPPSAHQMAYETGHCETPNLIGIAYLCAGIPVCWVIGTIAKLFNTRTEKNYAHG